MVLRRHTLDLKFGAWFLLISPIAQQNTFFAKRLKKGNQIDVHVDVRSPNIHS